MAQVLVVLSLVLASAFVDDTPPVRILFIGNSLTSVNDLPAMVKAVARGSGFDDAGFQVASVTRDGYSLRDHWNLGEARRLIERGGWTHVVLQQGPSSLPSSQEELIEYTKRFAGHIRAVRAQVVMYGVWPPHDRAGAQPAVTASYRRAAEAVDGVLVPVGEGWSAAWSNDGRSIYFVANMGVRSELFQLEITNGRARQITEGRHSIKGWLYAPALERHVFAIDEPTNPGDIWTLASTSSAPARVTRVFEYLIREFRHPRQERVEWKGADGVTVDGLLFYPLDYQEGQRYPLAVQTHGGPQASDNARFLPGNHSRFPCLPRCTIACAPKSRSIQR